MVFDINIFSFIRFQCILQEKNIIQITCGDYHSLALSKGTFLEYCFLEGVNVCICRTNRMCMLHLVIGQKYGFEFGMILSMIVKGATK